MTQRLHPYALIMGLGITIMVWAVIRHPLFAIFAGVVSTILLDMGFKAQNKDKDSGE